MPIALLLTSEANTAEGITPGIEKPQTGVYITK